MKRMKKKVVAMVTLAMFVLSMLPVAAFAAPANSIDAAKSTVTVDTQTAAVKGDVKVTVTANKADNSEVTGHNGYNNLYFWFESKDGKVYKQVNIAGENAKIDGNSALAVDGSVKDVVVSFNEAGTYELKAGVAEYAKSKEATTAAELTPVAIENGTITVTEPVSEVTNVASTGATVKLADKDGVQKTAVKATVTAKANIVKGTKLTVTNNDAARGLKVVDLAGKEATSFDVEAGNTTGEAVFYVVADKGTIAGEYRLNLECNGVTGTAVVIVEGPTTQPDKKAASIEAIPVEKLIDSSATDAEEAIAFAVRNAAGAKLNVKTTPATEPMVEDVKDTNGTTLFAHKNAVKVTGPVTVDADKLTFKYDSVSENMVLDMVSGTFAQAFTEAGEYTITVTLKNGATASSTFKVDKFGKLETIEIVPTNETVGDKIVVAQNKGTKLYEGTANFNVLPIDKNGIAGAALQAKDYTISASPAVADKLDVFVSDNAVSVRSKGNVKLEDILGTKVTLTAMYNDGTRDYMTVKEFTIVDNKVVNPTLLDYELTFDKNEANVMETLTVTPSVVNKNDKTDTKAVTKLYAKVLNQSNKDAKVYAKVDGTTIKVYANKDTTVDIQVLALVGTDPNFVNFGGTLTVTFGEKAVNADTIVGLTIGSKDMIVNNDVVKIDAAPFVDKNWRTMVPLSAITEAFGVTPEWNEKDRTVTVEMNGVKVVMTIDKQAYTVNGEKKTMDTAPVIVNSRTMVPVRFIAEELGFKVAPLYSVVDGTTEGVVISK